MHKSEFWGAFMDHANGRMQGDRIMHYIRPALGQSIIETERSSQICPDPFKRPRIVFVRVAQAQIMENTPEIEELFVQLQTIAGGKERSKTLGSL